MLNPNYIVNLTRSDGKSDVEVLGGVQTLAQLSILSKSITTPPAVAEGEIYVVAAASTGDWTGKDNLIAIATQSLWTFVTPLKGWLVWVADESLIYVYDGANWVVGGINGIPAGGSAGQALLKSTSASYVTVWTTVVPTGGTAGQVLSKNSGTDYDASWLMSPPIGAIFAWHKSFTNTPALPGQYVECNGQVLSDAASLYNGQTIPNLNASGGGSKRFLRGSTTSGTTAGSDTYTPAGTLGTPSATFSTSTGSTSVASSAHVHTFTGTSATVLPSYFEVVWIIRIK